MCFEWPISGYKTPAGAFAMMGIHGLPFILYCYKLGVLTKLFHMPAFLQYTLIGVLSAARALTMAVEVISCTSKLMVHSIMIIN